MVILTSCNLVLSSDDRMKLRLLRPGRTDLDQVMPGSYSSSLRICTFFGANAHLVALDAQHRDFDPFAGWGFNDDGFAWAAGADEHRASLPFCRYPRVTPGRCSCPVIWQAPSNALKYIGIMVEPRRIELPTFALRTRRSPS